MGRFTPKPFPDFPQLPIREVDLSLQLDVAGKFVYLLTATVMLFIMLRQLKCCCGRKTRVGGRVNVIIRVDNGAHTTSGPTEVHYNVTVDDDEDDTMGSQISGEAGFDDDDTNNGGIATSQTSLAASAAF